MQEHAYKLLLQEEERKKKEKEKQGRHKQEAEVYLPVHHHAVSQSLSLYPA